MLNGNAPFFKPLLTPFPHRKWVDTTIPSGWECSVFATYNDTSVLLKCTDSLNNIKYLVSYETGYNRNKGHPDISFKDIDNDEYNKIKDNYQCIEIDKEKANTIRFIKFLYIVGILLLLFIIVRKLLRFTWIIQMRRFC